jgi:hypothetical protein
LSKEEDLLIAYCNAPGQGGHWAEIAAWNETQGAYLHK